jgi:alkanesulfonate monooxygenase SsuD/methylene tetrahydromethanopterin reductase-like flavin-dependent oxidoreductase (luciferase family)
LAARFDNVRAEARKAGRNPDEVELACCLPVELTPTAGPQITDYLKGSVEQVADRLKQFVEIGVVHIGLQFMIPHYPKRREQIEKFAKESLPLFKS